ncbi:MAG: carotenoid biosynthesis protein [Planctomycetota bacterium]
MSPWVEPLSFAIVAGYLAALAWRADRAWAYRTFALLTAAGWLGEASCIRAYGFYAYDPGWRLWVDVVPLCVVCVWPVVILSALDLARALTADPMPRPAPLRAAGLCALLVLADAALIEPVAVRAGLWRWTAPGLFAVPPIGVLGWACFTLCAAAWLERTRGRPPRAAAVLLLAPLGCHLLLLALWWGALRWVSRPLPDLLGPALALPLAAVAARAAWRLPHAPPLGLVLARAPGALVFFALLAAHGRDQPTLIAYALAFALPYLALCLRRRSAPSERWGQGPSS